MLRLAGRQEGAHSAKRREWNKMGLFDGLGIKPEILKAVHEAGFTEPTPVQERAIPLLLEGRDVIAQAQTGTGKTAAFAVAILQRIHAAKQVQALVLVPTRELAVQVVEEFKLLGRHSPHSVLAVYGGENIDKQIRALQHGVQIVVGTPGRILDHLERRTLSLAHVRMAVLDEADRMLDMGFIDDVKLILSHAAAERQTLLCSATMPSAIIELARHTMRDPEVLNVSEDRIAVDKITQHYVGVDGRDKVPALLALFRQKKPSKTIVFTRTKFGAERLHTTLERNGVPSISLHGNLTQARREKSLQEFRERKGMVLVATDIAARGLDIDDVELIVNYDLPEEHMTYVHRIGRTARAGKEGDAVSFATNLQEKRFLEEVAAMAGATISEYPLEFKGRPASSEDTEYRGHGRSPYAHWHDDRRGPPPGGEHAPRFGRDGGHRGGGRPEHRGPRGGGFHGRGGGFHGGSGGGFHGGQHRGGPPHHGGAHGGRPPMHRRPPHHHR